MSESGLSGVIGGAAAQYGSDRSENCARREKYWDELDDAGKIERMRVEVKHLMREVEGLNATIAQLRGHQHGSLGQIVVPLEFGHYPPQRYRDDKRF